MSDVKNELRKRLNQIAGRASLCAKWQPRKGAIAVELREFLGLSPKAYRKLLVGLTNVVETKMCAKQWDEINFNHVPSKAGAMYRTAFHRNTPRFAAYVESLVKGEVGVKVNASAVYPYDVLKNVISTYGGARLSKTDLDFITAQWDALPNYVESGSVLPLVDVSGSMICPAGGYASKSGVTCLQVAVSLGLYLADKNTGDFKDMFCTFSAKPELLLLKGNIIQKVQQMIKSEWEMNTNVIAAFKKILDVAVKGKVPQADMPKVLLILSDMQFDQCARFDDSAYESIVRNYTAAGYEVPRIVFWNLDASGNAPVAHNKKGVALVSGFSPSIVKNVLSNTDKFTPEAIMLEAVMIDRYTL